MDKEGLRPLSKPLFYQNQLYKMDKYFQFISLANALAAYTAVYFAARPTLQNWGLRRHLMVLTGFHLFRYVGLTLALPQHFDWTSFGVPDRLAYQLAYWDFLNGLLALVAFVALTNRSRFARPLTWLFVAVAMGDQLISGNEVMPYIADATKIGAMPWILVTIYLPLLVVSSVAIIALLLSKKVKDDIQG
jgi:hypothetical protein